MKDTQESSTSPCDTLIDRGTKIIPCNESLWNFFPQHSVPNAMDLIEDKETYLERSLGFLIVGSIGIFSNLVAIFVLGSSVKIRQKLVNTLIIHQSAIDFTGLCVLGWHGTILMGQISMVWKDSMQRSIASLLQISFRYGE